MSTVTGGYAYDGAIMVTASHLPAERNGMKFFTPAGGVDKPRPHRDIEDRGERRGPRRREPGQVREAAFMDVYCALLADKVREALGEINP